MMEPIVTIEDGKLFGSVEKDFRGNPFYSFQSIPYARPPLGDLRFKAPEASEPWAGIRDATKEPDECYSRHMVTNEIVGTEDCLYLNVYTPMLPRVHNQAATALAVMFWIHGGAFIQGSSKREFYSPEFLIMHNVVLVTINYRLGLLGFLSLEDTSLGVPGNAGLKDTVMALRWVKKNIPSFSGNPNSVTIFGESAGSAIVEYLTLSPLSKDKGLFYRAILQSGSVLNFWATGTVPVEALAAAAGANSADAEQVLKLLQELSIEKLLEVQEKLPEVAESVRIPLRTYFAYVFQYPTYVAAALRPLGPVVEKNGTPEAFLTEDPLKVLESGSYNRIPLLFLYTKEEGIVYEVFLRQIGVTPIHTDFEDYIPRDLELKKGSNESIKLAQEIKELYYKDKTPSLETKKEFWNLETDSIVLRELYKSIRTRLKASNAPLYFCRFSLDAGWNFFKRIHNVTHLPGAAHGDELGYLFKSSITPANIPTEGVEDTGMERLTKLWTNFAKYGSPTAEKDLSINSDWKPAEPEQLHYLEINDELNIGEYPDFDRIAFWDKIYREYGNNQSSVELID